jgi:hypothetical protein
LSSAAGFLEVAAVCLEQGSTELKTGKNGMIQSWMDFAQKGVWNPLALIPMKTWRSDGVTRPSS